MIPDPELVERARALGAAVAAGGDLGETFALAGELAPTARDLGTDTAPYLRALLSLGAGDLTVARVVEPHLDALAILAQAPDEDDVAVPDGSEGVWGVYAAHGPGHHLAATPEGDGWVLTGRKPWCSLAAEVDRAVITAHTGPDRTRAFAVDLGQDGVRHPEQDWVARGLTRVPSTTLELDGVTAVPVGGDAWYLRRPGFAWGGIGVAAVWLGAAHALLASLIAASERREPDQVALMHVGHLDTVLHAAGCVLDDAARAIDAGVATGRDGAVLADRARGVCAAAAEEALRVAGHASGPAPLTGVEEHARRVADLTVYVRQHHAERDEARLGALLLDARRSG